MIDRTAPRVLAAALLSGIRADIRDAVIARIEEA